MGFHTHTATHMRISRRKKSTPRSKIAHINRIDAPDVYNYLHYAQRIEYIRSDGLLYTVSNPTIHTGIRLYIETFISILVWGLCDGFFSLPSFVFMLMLLLTLQIVRVRAFWCFFFSFFVISLLFAGVFSSVRFSFHHNFIAFGDSSAIYHQPQTKQEDPYERNDIICTAYVYVVCTWKYY